VQSKAQVLRDLLLETEGTQGTPCLVYYGKFDPVSREQKVRFEWFPIHLLEWIEKMEAQRN
jgi:hypothetical protein